MCPHMYQIFQSMLKTSFRKIHIRGINKTLLEKQILLQTLILPSLARPPERGCWKAPFGITSEAWSTRGSRHSSCVKDRLWSERTPFIL